MQKLVPNLFSKTKLCQFIKECCLCFIANSNDLSFDVIYYLNMKNNIWYNLKKKKNGDSSMRENMSLSFIK